MGTAPTLTQYWRPFAHEPVRAGRSAGKQFVLTYVVAASCVRPGEPIAHDGASVELSPQRLSR